MRTKLSKWGNSLGVRMPRRACDALGIEDGAEAAVSVDVVRSSITLTFDAETPRYARRRKVTCSDLLTTWDGTRVGREWGGPDVGAEVVD